MDQLRDLLEADLGLAARDDRCHRLAGRRTAHLACLAGDLVRNAEFLEPYGRQIRAARAVRIGDGFRGEQRFAQGLDCADVGLGLARPHHHADERLGERHPAAGPHQVARLQNVGAVPIHDQDIRLLAAREASRDRFR